MKLNLGKRLVLFVYWLASLAVLAMLVIPQYANIAVSYVNGLIPADYMQYVEIALLIVYLLLSLGVLCMVFKRSAVKRSDRGFITVDSADSGKVRISISAIEQMVRQAAYTVDGISDMKISITNADDAIAIGLIVTMLTGHHVPTVTLNLQRAIRQYVEMNSGVAVRSVSVSIQSVASSEESGRKSKRRDAKAAQNVQKPEIEPAPMSIPAVSYESQPVEQPAYAAEPISAEPAYAAVEAVEESSAEEPVVTAIEESTTEEEKEN